MHNSLIQYAQKFVALTQKDIQQLQTRFKEVYVAKKQLIVQPGFVNTTRSFVVKGAFRTYIITPDGIEQTLQFAIENWWISDFNSYLYQQPATLFIVALENSQILQIHFEDEQALKLTHPNINSFFRIMAEKGLAFEHRRILFDLTHDAEARYNNFLHNYPNFLNRVPQYALASYLGMSPEFLSRIRHKKVKGKPE